MVRRSCPPYLRLTPPPPPPPPPFLASGQAPETAMPFETLDGFFTALVIGPDLVMPSAYLREIWGTEDGSGPVWGSMEQLQYFMGLLQSIGMRLLRAGTPMHRITPTSIISATRR